MNSFENRLKEEKEKENKGIMEKVANEKRELSKTVAKNRERIADIIFFIFYALIVFSMIGLLELIDASYDKNMFSSPAFWVDYASLQTAMWTSRILIRKMGDRREYRNNILYIDYQKNIKSKIDKDEETPFIDELSQIERRERKISAFKNQQRLKIINIAMKYQITNIFSGLKSIETTKIEDLERFELTSDKNIRKRKEKRLNTKLNQLLKTLTNEWIEENIETQKVKFNDISRAILTSGVISSKSDENNEDFKDNATREFIKMTVPSALFAMAFTFLVLPLRGDFIKEISAWFKFIVKIMMIFFTSLMMWFDNPTLFDRTKNKAMGERSNKLNQYYRKKFDKR